MQQRFVLVGPQHRLRPDVEAAIRCVYAAHYGASIREFPSKLVSMVDAGDRPLAACGIRTADDGFFSECYLDLPVEAAIADRFGTVAERYRGIEITTLAAMCAGDALQLVTGIVPAAQRAGIRWACFTATRRLRRLLSRAGLRFEALAAADPAAIANAADWGSYYETDPWVCALHAVDFPLRDFRVRPGFSRRAIIDGAVHA